MVRIPVIGRIYTVYREYIVRIYGHIYGHCFFFLSIFGHVLALYWPYMAIYGQGGASGLYFFHRCARRDGGRAGRRADVARIDEKKGRASTLDSIFRPYMNHIFPEHARLFPVLAGYFRFWPGISGVYREYIVAGVTRMLAKNFGNFSVYFWS